MVRALLSLLALVTFAAPAYAGRVPPEPQIRLHAGLSVSDGLGIGGAVGLDSRMTRLVYIDMGGFFTPVPLAEDLGLPADPVPGDLVRLRHALYVTPGIRIPHKVSDGLIWDVIFRGGLAVAWATNLDPDDTVDGHYASEVQPSAVGGVDFLLRKGQYGVRASGKALSIRTLEYDNAQVNYFVRPQGAVEFFYQF